MDSKREVYVCPGCGDELGIYEIEPLSMTDVGADRREETGNYFCPECNLDYEPISVVDEAAMVRIEERLEKLVAHAAEAMDRFNPVPGNEEGDIRAFGANASRRGGLEDALKVVRDEEDSIGDSA